MFDIPLFPARASTIAGEVDALYFFLVGLSGFFSVLIATLIVAFAIRFRRRHPDEVGAQVHGGLLLEIGWTVIPFLITMVIFFWGAKVYFAMANPPAETLNIYVVGKQWMWKVQHATGQREINELHVPVGRPVRLIMTSEDVIHNFSMPAMRVKADVIPGRIRAALVSTDAAGDVSDFLRRVLRHTAFRHDWPGRRAGAGGVSGLAERRRR